MSAELLTREDVAERVRSIQDALERLRRSYFTRSVPTEVGIALSEAEAAQVLPSVNVREGGGDGG